jgi:hypothetical protein
MNQPRGESLSGTKLHCFFVSPFETPALKDWRRRRRRRRKRRRGGKKERRRRRRSPWV